MDDNKIAMELRTARTLAASAMDIQDGSWIKNGAWGSPNDYTAVGRDKAEKFAERLFQELASRSEAQEHSGGRVVSLASHGGLLYAAKNDGSLWFRTTDGEWNQISTP